MAKMKELFYDIIDMYDRGYSRDEISSELDISMKMVDDAIALSESMEEDADEETEWVLVETVLTYRIRYCVEVPKGKAEWALDTVTMEEAKEFSQKSLGETIVSHRVVTEEEALAICKEDNDYVNSWDEDMLRNNFFHRRGDEPEWKVE